MDEDYPTDLNVLMRLDADQWDRLLTRLERVRLTLPRPVVWLDFERKRVEATVVRRDAHLCRAKLNRDVKSQIINAIRDGQMMSKIAREFGVSRQRVHQIKKQFFG